ncbi:MAG: histidine phosphatase family protein [Ilumatobacteraceae bacterium]
MTRLIFVRHGESNTTVARKIGGFRTCSGLSPLGRLQSEKLRDRLAASGEITADVLISSQFVRARETAEIVAPALGGLEIEEIAGFGEHDPGEECDGITFDEFVDRYGEREWESDPFSIGFPGGETLAQFHLRIGETIADTLSRHAGKTVVVFCHGGVVDAALRQALKSPAVGAFDIWTLNTSITELQLIKPGRWRLLRYNDHAHLAGLDAETPKDVPVEAMIDTVVDAGVETVQDSQPA